MAPNLHPSYSPSISSSSWEDPRSPRWCANVKQANGWQFIISLIRNHSSRHGGYTWANESPSSATPKLQVTSSSMATALGAATKSLMMRDETATNTMEVRLAISWSRGTRMSAPSQPSPPRQLKWEVKIRPGERGKLPHLDGVPLRWSIKFYEKFTNATGCYILCSGALWFVLTLQLKIGRQSASMR